jgi:C4-type Zn-finger protein
MDSISEISVIDASRVTAIPTRRTVCPVCAQELSELSRLQFARWNGRHVNGPAVVCTHCGYCKEFTSL